MDEMAEVAFALWVRWAGCRCSDSICPCEWMVIEIPLVLERWKIEINQLRDLVENVAEGNCKADKRQKMKHRCPRSRASIYQIRPTTAYSTRGNQKQGKRAHTHSHHTSGEKEKKSRKFRGNREKNR